MDNSQFRNLLKMDKTNQPTADSSKATTFKTPMLGSRARASIPMTPRSVAGHNKSNEFARQVAEQKRRLDGEPPAKKFKSTAAPRGTKLAQGYQDRTQLRRGEDEDTTTQDDKEKRLKALEDMVKLQQIDQRTFEKLRDEIGVGGDVGTAHLVKGLDWKLLEKARRGDDLNQASIPEDEQVEEAGQERVNVDEELDTVLDKEVEAPIKHARTEIQERSATASKQGPVMTRDEILRRLKESRRVESAPVPLPTPALGDRFKKVSATDKPDKKKFVETINGRRREVLVTTDREGRTKRKTRWIDSESAVESTKPVQSPMGMEVPAEFAAKQKALLAQQAAEDENDDIFQGVGADYNPLGEIENDSDNPEASDLHTDHEPAAAAGTANRLRNYFSTETQGGSTDNQARTIGSDPTILAALKRAAALRQSEGHSRGNVQGDAEDIDPERALKRRQFLDKLKQQERDDARDMDLSFGESRVGDEDEEDGPIWEGDEGEDAGGRGGQKHAGRKRGSRKRKGDKDSVTDVMSVLEGRKKA